MHRACCLESLGDFRQFLWQRCTGLPGMDVLALYYLQLALDEARTNVIAHGYANMPRGSLIVQLDLQPGLVTVAITDFGRSFDPGAVALPDTNATIEARDAGGYGLFFIKHSVDRMDYRVTEDGNTMVLTKYLSVGGKA